MFHLIIRYAGLDLVAKLAKQPAIGQIVRIKAGAHTIPLMWDGSKLVSEETRPVVKPMPYAGQPIPAWAFDSVDPRIEYMVDCSTSGDEFYAMLYGSAWKDALLIKGDAAPEETALGLRWEQLDAKQARMARRSLTPGKDIRNAVKHPRLGRKDEAGEYLAALGQDDPVTPEDAVVFATDTADMDAMAELVSSDAERDGDWGVEQPRVEWSMDVIGELLAHTGKIRVDGKLDNQALQAEKRLKKIAKHNSAMIEAAEGQMAMINWNDHSLANELHIKKAWADLAHADELQNEIDNARSDYNRKFKAATMKHEPQYPLATVIATLAAKRRAKQFTEKQLAFIERILGKAGTYETVEMRKNAKGEHIPCTVTHHIVNRLWNNIQALEIEIDEALDSYEQMQAQWDEIAHPRKAADEPRVEVSVDRQATFLDYVAKEAKKGDKPWFSHPSYIAVLSAAFESGARTPKEAHNRAYAADTMSMPDRILGYDSKAGFTVMLNKTKGQTGTVSGHDANAVYPHLPRPAQVRMRQMQRAAKAVAPLAQ